MLGAPVGGLHLGPGQEGEQRIAFAGQMVQQPPVGWVGGASGKQPVDGRTQPLDFASDLGGIQLVGVTLVADQEGTLEDAAHRVWGLGLPALGVGQQLTAAAQQVRQAGLVRCGDEPAVGRPPVAFQHPA
jgi:hypothetical protein